MKHRELPDLDLETFAAQLDRACQEVSGAPPPRLSHSALSALHAHYVELRRWNRRLALIGPGTVHVVLERHYAESLAALPLLPPPTERPSTTRPRVLVDLGSGAGFPGWVLAAVRPDLVVFLVESRERKVAFLQAATRKAADHLRDPRGDSRRVERADPRGSLPIHCLSARVGVPLPAPLPSHLDFVTARALRIERDVWSALARRMTTEGRCLLWLGSETPPLPPELAPRRELLLSRSEHRRILELSPDPVTPTP